MIPLYPGGWAVFVFLYLVTLASDSAPRLVGLEFLFKCFRMHLLSIL
jgi:hypothetical protein